MTRTDNLRASLSEYGVPAHLHDGLIAYMVEHLQPSGFLTVVLENNLMATWNMADSESRDKIGSLIKWLWWEAPMDCWGSKETVAAWLAARPVAGPAEMKA